MRDLIRTSRFEDSPADRRGGHSTVEVVLPSYSIDRRVDGVVHQSYRNNAQNMSVLLDRFGSCRYDSPSTPRLLPKKLPLRVTEFSTLFNRSLKEEAPRFRRIPSCTP